MNMMVSVVYWWWCGVYLKCGGGAVGDGYNVKYGGGVLVVVWCLSDMWCGAWAWARKDAWHLRPLGSKTGREQRRYFGDKRFNRFKEAITNFRVFNRRSPTKTWALCILLHGGLL